MPGHLHEDWSGDFSKKVGGKRAAQIVGAHHLIFGVDAVDLAFAFAVVAGGMYFLVDPCGF